MGLNLSRLLTTTAIGLIALGVLDNKPSFAKGGVDDPVNVVGTVAVEPGAAPIAIEGGNASPVTVDGNVGVSGQVSVEGGNAQAIKVGDGDGPLTVDGQVTIGNTPTVKIDPASNDVDATITGTVKIDGGNSNPVKIGDGAGALTVDGTVQIGNTPTVKIDSNSDVNVVGEVQVHGEVEIANQPTVKVEGGNTAPVKVEGSVELGGPITANINNSAPLLVEDINHPRNALHSCSISDSVQETEASAWGGSFELRCEMPQDAEPTFLILEQVNIELTTSISEFITPFARCRLTYDGPPGINTHSAVNMPLRASETFVKGGPGTGGNYYRAVVSEQITAYVPPNADHYLVACEFPSSLTDAGDVVDNQALSSHDDIFSGDPGLQQVGPAFYAVTVQGHYVAAP